MKLLTFKKNNHFEDRAFERPAPSYQFVGNNLVDHVGICLASAEGQFPPPLPTSHPDEKRRERGFFGRGLGGQRSGRFHCITFLKIIPNRISLSLKAGSTILALQL